MVIYEILSLPYMTMYMYEIIYIIRQLYELYLYNNIHIFIICTTIT